MNRKILTIIGARPQFVKAATISRELKKAEIKEIIVHTGQHFDDNMSKIFFDEMDIPKPNYNLNIHSVSHGAMTGRMIEKIEEILLREKPDIVLVYGDTNSTLAGALAAKKLHIKVAHVEAGLRSYNMDMPEEINRILTDRISDTLFCPTETAVNNLLNEGYGQISCDIKNVGDVMYDLFLAMRPNFNAASLMKKHGLGKGSYILVTLHRDFNVDDPRKLKAILDGLVALKKTLGLKIFFPIHPRTSKRVVEYGLEYFLNEFEISEPIGYFELMGLSENCAFVITDSGGFQKEAYFAEKRALIVMPDTGWRELTDAGWNVLTDPDSLQILEKGRSLVQASVDYPGEIYGNGRAAEKIVDILYARLKVSDCENSFI